MLNWVALMFTHGVPVSLDELISAFMEKPRFIKIVVRTKYWNPGETHILSKKKELL